MTEQTIVCPNCKTEFKLTESLAAPLIEAVRRQYEQQITQKDIFDNLLALKVAFTTAVTTFENGIFQYFSVHQ